MTEQTKILNIGIKLHLRELPGSKRPFVLLHGLASNSLTWQGVAAHLNEAGHRVIAVDQRGHGLSEKPNAGYDFTTIATDLARLLEALQLENPILVGQSWGGNVLLEFGARYPHTACGMAWIDGGFIDLQSRPNATWEQLAEQLKPPNLVGTPRSVLKESIQLAHPDWADWGIEATLGNFETRPDGTVNPWLTLERHMAILRSMWDQRPRNLYALVAAPTLICVAETPDNSDWNKVKAIQVMAALNRLNVGEVQWFANTDHDIHVQRPAELAQLLLASLNNGFWQRCTV